MTPSVAAPGVTHRSDATGRSQGFRDSKLGLGGRSDLEFRKGLTVCHSFWQRCGSENRKSKNGESTDELACACLRVHLKLNLMSECFVEFHGHKTNFNPAVLL